MCWQIFCWIHLLNSAPLSFEQWAAAHLLLIIMLELQAKHHRSIPANVQQVLRDPHDDADASVRVSIPRASAMGRAGCPNIAGREAELASKGSHVPHISKTLSANMFRWWDVAVFLRERSGLWPTLTRIFFISRHVE